MSILIPLSERIERARGKIMSDHVFYTSIMLTVDMVEDNTITETAATDMKKVYYNSDYLSDKPFILIASIIIHELLHIILKHGLRKGWRDHDIWNDACDYAVNALIVESGLPIGAGWLYDARFVGMSAETIYNILVQDGARKRGNGDGPGEDLIPPSQDPAEMAKIETSIDQRVASATERARAVGALPGFIKRMVDGELHPKLPWKQILRDYAVEVCRDRESWSRRNKRYPHIYLPGRHGKRMGELVVIGDTSGSIRAEEHQELASEVSSIALTVRPTRIRLVWWDTELKGEQVFARGDKIKVEPEGGGGTDMVTAFEYVMKFNPMVVILHTDGYTPWPMCVPYPLIICCTTNVNVPPIGDVIRTKR